MNIEIRNNLKFTTNVQTGLSGYSDSFDGWSYERQSAWGGMCKEVGAQSPIDIITTEIAATTNQMQVKTNYKGDVDVVAVRGT